MLVLKPEQLPPNHLNIFGVVVKTIDLLFYYHVLTGLQTPHHVLLERTQRERLTHLNRLQRHLLKERTHVDRAHQVGCLRPCPHRLSRSQYSSSGARPTIQRSVGFQLMLSTRPAFSLRNTISFLELLDFLYLFLVVRQNELSMLFKVIRILLSQGYFLPEGVFDGAPSFLATRRLRLTVIFQLRVGPGNHHFIKFIIHAW